MNEKSSLEQVVELEQHFIYNLNPNLNLDLIARSSGSEKIITPLAIYNSDEKKLALEENRLKSGVYR